jgi:bifunctional ADP-heptose synthase (sugar kinase/adenylyltransferase)
VDAIRGQIEKQLALQIAPESPVKVRRDTSSAQEEEGGGGDVATNLKSSDIDNLHKVGRREGGRAWCVCWCSLCYGGV